MAAEGAFYEAQRQNAQHVLFICSNLTFGESRKVIEESLMGITTMSDQLLEGACAFLFDKRLLMRDEIETIENRNLLTSRMARAIKFADIVKTKTHGLQRYVEFLSEKPEQTQDILSEIGRVVQKLYPRYVNRVH